jgi:hypothetical protein
MLKFLPMLAAIAGLLALPAVAQEHRHPNLVGTWKGEIDAVSVGSGEDAKPAFGTFTATVEITDAQDERFAGTFQFESETPTPFVGVFTEPGRILWAEPNGFAHGRVINNEIIEVCYVRATAAEQVASCERYQRQH